MEPGISLWLLFVCQLDLKTQQQQKQQQQQYKVYILLDQKCFFEQLFWHEVEPIKNASVGLGTPFCAISAVVSQYYQNLSQLISTKCILIFTSYSARWLAMCVVQTPSGLP